jgi:hypothetical protein
MEGLGMVLWRMFFHGCDEHGRPQFDRDANAQLIYLDFMLMESFVTRLATATTRSFGATGFAMWVS